MTRVVSRCVLVLSLLGTSLHAQQRADTALVWTQSWPGTQFALVSGDPSVAGREFRFRFRMPSDYWIPPHIHSGTANIRVLSGEFLIGMGERMDTTKAKAYAAGTNAVIQSGMAHFEGTRGETVVEVSGIGPWTIKFLEMTARPGPFQSLASPRADHHQHLFSPAAGALVSGDSTSRGISVRELVARLDSAGIRRALVLSMGYTWGSANRTVENEYEKVKAENDWTSQQVAQYPDRLRAFCSLNPRKPYAFDELARCAKDAQLKHGLKLHLGNSDVDLDNAENVEEVRKIFQAANQQRMPIIVHMRTSISRSRKYGRDQALVFLNQLLPAARDIPVQIAHLAGAGDYDEVTDAALNVFVEAIANRDARMKNVWFDVTTVVRPGITPEKAKLVATRLRQLGLERVLFGSDATAGGNLPPRESWAAFLQLPLTETEFRTIAENVPPYLKW